MKNGEKKEKQEGRLEMKKKGLKKSNEAINFSYIKRKGKRNINDCALVEFLLKYIFSFIFFR